MQGKIFFAPVDQGGASPIAENVVRFNLIGVESGTRVQWDLLG